MFNPPLPGVGKIMFKTCTILYYTVLYRTILYYTVLYCTILYYTVLYCTILYRWWVGESGQRRVQSSI